MIENNKDFIFKLIVITVAVFAFYYYFSPYQNCTRNHHNSDANSKSIKLLVIEECTEKTSW